METSQKWTIINALYKRTKAGELPLDERMAEISRDIEFYEINSAEQLDKLADLCLYEDITDDTAWKTRQTEYPFLSATQLSRRREGTQQRKNEGGQREVSLKAAGTLGMNGFDYRKPVRREMSINDMLLRDKAVQSKNAERRRQYNEFTRVQPVITYRRSELIDPDIAAE